MLNNRIYSQKRAGLLLTFPPSTAKLLSATHFPESISMLDKGLCFQPARGGLMRERWGSILPLGQKASKRAQAELAWGWKVVFHLPPAYKVQAGRFTLLGGPPWMVGVVKYLAKWWLKCRQWSQGIALWGFFRSAKKETHKPPTFMANSPFSWSWTLLSH